MSDITTQELDTTVQAALKDWRVSPYKRAKIALDAIEAHVRAETGVEGPLPVPLEWEHRVSGMADEEPQPVRTEVFVVAHDDEPVGTMEVVEGEVVDDGDLKDAFDALWDGDDERAELKFRKFWEWKE